MQKSLASGAASGHLSTGNNPTLMRPITKIFLLLVVAFVVYLLWPRTADLKNFDPAKLAELQVASWQAEKADKGLGALTARFKIYTSQYHFDPISAYRIAQNQASAIKSLKLSRQENGDTNEESRAIAALTEKYTAIAKIAKLEYDSAAVAREEFGFLLSEYLANSGQAAAEGTTIEDAAVPLSKVFAALYGGEEGDFLEVADGIVKARSLIFKGDPSTGQPDAFTAKTTATDAYKLLSEIAKTPPADAAAPAEQ